jgi:predicted porin
LQASLNEPGSSTGRLLAGVVTWQDRGLLLKGLYEEIRDRDGNFSNLYGASRLATIGATYDLGGLKLFLARSQVQSDKSVVADAENPSEATRQDTTWFGVNYQATPALSLIGGAYRAVTDLKGDTGTLLALGANYSLSKQTMLFVTTGRVHNGANGVFPVEANGGRPPVGLHQRNAYAGMIYWF